LVAEKIAQDNSFNSLKLSLMLNLKLITTRKF